MGNAARRRLSGAILAAFAVAAMQLARPISIDPGSPEPGSPEPDEKALATEGAGEEHSRH